MPQPTPDADFDIYVDQSCLNTPLSEDRPHSHNPESADVDIPSARGPDAVDQEDTITSASESTPLSVETGNAQVADMAENNDAKPAVRHSIEEEHVSDANGEEAAQAQDYEQAAHPSEDNCDDVGDSSVLMHDQDQEDDSDPEDVDDSESHVYHGDDSSSHHEATDEDVFSDNKSPRSSMGSYDGIPEPRKAYKDLDNMTTSTRSPRISDISQYEKEYEREEFVPTARGTPRPPFRTPSDVRAMQMSSPPPSVLGSPRSTKRHFPTVSRLGTPTAPTQYSPKRMSTPPRFKQKEAPLVLLHVTLLPLRWVWGDLLGSLDTDELSEQAKALRESWRILQDRIGDTVIDRGILLGHPQNDYEVLEERLLEALELPLRRRARILECGHYIGPANEGTLTEDEESDDEWGSVRSRATSRRHWCGTCKNEIRYDSLGAGKIFRVKVYASNGLMKAGAWAACWKEMERVDVELEPIVEPDVQDELVRLAARQEEREFTHHEEAEIAKEVAQQLQEQHQKEHTGFDAPHRPEGEPFRSPRSEAERRWRDEERMREIYGDSPPSPSPKQSPSREPSTHPQQDSYVPPPSPPGPRQPSSEKTYEQESHKQPYQNASLPELLLQSVRVLMSDRKNVIIFTLGVFVLMLALRNNSAPNEPIYEPVIHRMRDVPVVHRAQIMETSSYGQATDMMSQHYTLSAEPIPSGLQESQETSRSDSSSVVTPDESASEHIEQILSESDTPRVESSAPQEPQVTTSQQQAKEEDFTANKPDYDESPEGMVQQDAPEGMSVAASSNYQDSVELQSHSGVAIESSAAASCSTVYEPCNTAEAPEREFQSAAAPQPEETETETVTEKKVVRVVHTVTRTELYTEVETATETVKATATEATAADAEATEQSAQVDAEEPTEPVTEKSDPATLSEVGREPAGEEAAEEAAEEVAEEDA